MNKLSIVLLLALASAALSKVVLNKSGITPFGNDYVYIGVNDKKITLFEGQYPVKNGMAYNSYLIKDSKTAIIDTVDVRMKDEWFKNIEAALEGKQPDYLIILHMEPDHAGSIGEFMKKYTKTQIVSSFQAFEFMAQFFGSDYADRRIVVNEGVEFEVGKHKLLFVEAPFVHWPEVILAYDNTTKTLFSSDAFGKFGANDVEEDWLDEARRYFIGIVGKYGKEVQNLFNKVKTFEFAQFCPSHGPILNENLGYYVDKYQKWSSYTPEEEGILIAYTSVYGHTKEAVEKLAQKLKDAGAPKVVVRDLARTDHTVVIAEAFKYSKLILATTTYNSGIFPIMRDFINGLISRNFQKRVVGLLGNGSWAPQAEHVMKEMFKDSKRIIFPKKNIRIESALNENSEKKMDKFVKEFASEYLAINDATANKKDETALFNIGYGLYVITSNDGKKDNGLIVNTVVQFTVNPLRIGVSINKSNYSFDVIKSRGVMNLNILNQEAPFEVFTRFGFQSGRSANKFEGFTEAQRSDNGLLFLTNYINSFMSLKVVDYVDLGTHGLFLCEVTESRVLNHIETMTYSHYQNCVKPKPDYAGKSGYVCKVCGFIYEGEKLPQDYICPICKHGCGDFIKIEETD